MKMTILGLLSIWPTILKYAMTRCFVKVTQSLGLMIIKITNIYVVLAMC